MAAERGPELFSPHPFPVKPSQARQNEQFRRAFEDKTEQIPTAEQTRQALTWHAVKLACDRGGDTRTLYETLRDLRPGAERGLVHVQWRRLFPKAPSWSPVRNLKAPVIGIGEGAHRKWGKIVWRKNLVLGELRRQKRRLFPKAPKWSPVHGWEVSVLRLTKESAKSTQSARLAKPTKTQRKDKSQSQSQ